MELLFRHNEQSIIVKLFVANQIFIAEHVSVYATHHQPPSSAFDFKQVRTIKGIQYILFLAGDIDTFFLLPTAIQHEGRHQGIIQHGKLCRFLIRYLYVIKEFSGFHLIDIDLPGSCQHKDQSRILVHIYLLEIVELSGTTTPRTDVPDKLSIRRILIQPRITGNKPIFTGLYHLPRIYKIDQALIIRFQRNILYGIGNIAQLNLPLDTDSCLERNGYRILRLHRFEFDSYRLFDILSRTSRKKHDYTQQKYFSIFHIYIDYIVQIFYLFQVGVFQHFPCFLFFFLTQGERIEFSTAFTQFLFFFPGFFNMFLHLLAPQTFIFRHLR